ncbi:MAG: cell wall-binding repeat-containing protein [Tissierellia bacterium]|nr:cell wall-binding repeat-containing protein [Tissierellia bacterium]
MKQKNRLIALLLTVFLMIPLLSNFSSSQAIKDGALVRRIYGNNRFDTSLKVSKQGFDSAEYAVIVNGQNFPDALVGGVLAGTLEGPLLLSAQDNVNSHLIQELERLQVKTVYILGGHNSLSANIDRSLAKYNPQRIAGKNRCDTAKQVGKVVKDHKGKINDIYYADGRNFPDALAAAPYVADSCSVLLLNDGRSINSGIAIGGHNSVPGNTSRISGNNRYETATELAKQYANINGVILVNGTNYPDALSASGIASKFNLAILLTEKDRLTPTTKQFIQDHGITDFLIIGGKSSISDTVIHELKNLSPGDFHSSLEKNESKSTLEGNISKPILEESKPKPTLEESKPRPTTEGNDHEIYGSFDLNTPLSHKEKELIQLVNDYRKSQGLKELPISKSLTYVARTHARDLQKYRPQDQKDSRGIKGNTHSWSNHGNWSPVIYTPDHKYSDKMWSKPGELTAYPGYGYEIVCYMREHRFKITPKKALDGWKTSPDHNDVIIGREDWKDLTTMGVAIDGSYASIWFGEEPDPAGYFK